MSLGASPVLLGLAFVLMAATVVEARGRARSVAAKGPYVVVLGTAQDGGLPQVGCEEDPCRLARRDASRRRLVASILIADPRTGHRWLIDASPDLREQVELADPHPPTRRDVGPRPPLFEGIFLTHAHVGHYAGLIHLGCEAYGARGVPLHGTPRMLDFLRGNGPWSLLVELGNVDLHALQPRRSVPLGDDLSITPFLVPHRGEFTDTVGFLVKGPHRSLAYVPDIDKWARWDRRVEDLLAEVDVALLDGTFFAEGEIPGRSMASIPHPFIVESLDRLRELPEKERAKVVFTHLNHTNPAANRSSKEARTVRDAGMSVATDGQVFEL